MKNPMSFTVGSLLSLALLCAGCAANREQAPPQIVDQRYVHKYGVDVPSQDWAQRGKDGKVISSLSDGVIVTNTYQAGILNGETIYTFPYSKSIAKVEEYVHGNLEKQTEYYPSGSPRTLVVFQDVRYDYRQSMSTWYESGTPATFEVCENGGIVKAEYRSPDNIVESEIVDGSGMRTKRDSYGQLLSHDIFDNCQLVKITSYHPNGNPAEVTHFRDGVCDGERITFYPGGEPKCLEEWVGGKQHGVTLTFVNGEKVSEIPYVNNVKTGVERRYVNGEEIVEEISWLGNYRHGPSRTYLGDIQKVEWYYRGQKVSKTNYEKMEKDIVM